MTKINSTLLNQFHQHGLSINRGIAVDTRLVKSVSQPISQQELKKLIQNAKTPEGKMDKNGNKKKYSRNLDSDWTVKNEKPHFGFKEHTAMHTNYGRGL